MSSLFERTAPAHQWTGALDSLLPELRRRAFNMAMRYPTPEATLEAREHDRDFAWVVLPRDAVVCYRIRGDLAMRAELRIARAEPLENPAAWRRELDVFMRAFGAVVLDGSRVADADGYWLVQPPHPNDQGKTAVRFIELRPGECAPDETLCPMCAEQGMLTRVPIPEQQPLGSATGCARHEWGVLSKKLDEAEQRRRAERNAIHR